MNTFKQNLTKSLAFSLIVSAITMIQFFAIAENAGAAAVCANATVHVVAREQGGTIIPGISYEILEEATNSDGKIRPGKIVSAGKIDAILGEGKSSFSPASGKYIVKMYNKNHVYGAFYFYNQLTVACGEEKTFTGFLSGLQIELRDTDGALRENTSFTISQQAYDANGGPVKEKGASIATLNSDVYGQNKIYLADSSHTIDQAPISYVFSTRGYGLSEFALYGIILEDKKIKEINYFFSDILIKFRDKNTNNLPAGTKVEFLTQKDNAAGLVAADKLINILNIDNNGYIRFEYPAGSYFLRIRKTNGDYYNFPNIGIYDRTRTYLTLDVLDSSAEAGVCATNSTLNVVARKAGGGYISGIKLELYEQALNANNLPAPGALVVSGATNDLGFGSVSFKSNSGKTYILKMYDKNSKIGAFWFYDEIKFSCGENKRLEKKLSSLSLTVRDTSGSLLKDYGFSLYLQKKNIDNHVIKTRDNLVADLKTDANGQATIYVTGGDPVQYQDAARYLISIKNSNGMIFDKPDINLTAGADSQVNYSLSGLNLTMIDAANNSLSKGTKVEIYEQKTDLSNHKILVKSVSSLTLDDYGKGLAALPAGAYALILKDQGGKLMNIWDIKIENDKLNNQTATVPLLRLYAVDGAGNSLKNINVYVYSLTKNADGWYKKNKIIFQTTGLNYADIVLAAGQYLATVKLGASEYGATVDIGNSSLKKAYLSTSPENLVKPESVYKIITPTPVFASSPLADRLRGYVLLQTESRGEAWYVSLNDKKRYYLEDGTPTLAIMKRFSLGVKNSDLNKIPIGVLPAGGEADCDHDGLPDSLEKAIGTAVCDKDSDGDGYSDSLEVLHNYHPLGQGKSKIDQKLAARLSGNFLLQAQANGEVWYVNPRDKKRYYVKDGPAAYLTIKYLSLGITDANLNLINRAE